MIQADDLTITRRDLVEYAAIDAVTGKRNAIICVPSVSPHTAHGVLKEWAEDVRREDAGLLTVPSDISAAIGELARAGHSDGMNCERGSGGWTREASAALEAVILRHLRALSASDAALARAIDASPGRG